MKPLRLLPLVLVLASCDGSRSAAKAESALEAGWTGRTQPMEVIHARFELMKHMELLMEPIDTIQLEPVKYADHLRSNAAAISAMLLTVPHLFPPTTNLYQPEGPEFPTLALPTIWRNFEAFNKMALAASRAAQEVAEAGDNAALKAAGAKLRAGCDACHRLFERKYIPQQPQASDYEFDFDDALPIDRQ